LRFRSTTVVYDRYRLSPGATFECPAVVEERESTVVLGTGSRTGIDEARNLVVRWSG
jgi:N-methylhydantoinase A